MTTKLPKAIAFDLDHTVYTDDRQLTPFTISTLKALHDKGVSLIPASGRPISGVREVVKTLDLKGDTDYAITYNGAAIVRNQDESIASGHPLDAALVSQLLHIYHTFQIPFDFIGADTVMSLTDYSTSHYSERLNWPMKFFYMGWRTLPRNFRAYKMGIYNEPRILDQLEAQMRPMSEGNFTLTRSDRNMMEIMAPGITKGSGIKEVLAMLKIDPADLVAFGDEDNDLPMLKLAGQGVAMGNARPEVKAQVKFTTDSNNEDGLAKYLQQFINL